MTGVIRAFFQCGPAALLIIQTQCWLDSKTSQQWVLPAAQTPHPPSLPFRWTVLLGDRISVSIKFKLWSSLKSVFCVHGTSPRLPVVAVPSVASLLFVWIHNVLYGSGCFGARVLDLTDPWRCCPIHTLNVVCGYAPSNLRRISSRCHCFPSLQPAVNRRKTKEVSIGVLIIRHSEHQLSDFRL